MSDAPAAVRLEAHRGELVLGATIVEARGAGPRGALRIGGAEGPVLRPVSFGERTRAAARSATTSAPRDALSAALLQASTVVDGPADRLVMEAAALWLAGAAESGPSFGDTVLAVARGSGWDPSQIAEAEAAEVDRLAATLGAASREPGWVRVLLGAGAAEQLLALRDAMADTLLARAVVETATGPTASDELDSWRAPARPGEHVEAAARGAAASLDAPSLAPTPQPAHPDGAWRARAPAAATSRLDTSAAPGSSSTSSGPPPARRHASATTTLPRRASGQRAAPEALRPMAPAASTAAVSRAAAAGPAPSAPARALAADVAPLGPSLESPAPLEDHADLADRLAVLLDDEADLRGLAR